MRLLRDYTESNKQALKTKLSRRQHVFFTNYIFSDMWPSTYLFSASGWIFFGEESSLRWTTISKVTVKKYLSKASSSMSRKKSLNNFLNSS